MPATGVTTRPVVRALAGVLVLVPIGFLTGSVARNWNLIEESGIRPDWWGALAAVVILTAGFSLLPIGTRFALAVFGEPPTFRITYVGYFLSQLAKYLPGGLWIVPGRIAMFKVYGVSPVCSGVGILIELCLLIGTGCAAFGPYALIVGAAHLPFGIPVFLGWMAALAVGFHPRIVNPLLRFVLRQTKYRGAEVTLKYGQILRLCSVYFLFWMIVGVGFVQLVRSAFVFGFRESVAVGAAFALAWIAGFLAFLTPGGLGVREGVLAVLLTPLLPAPLPSFVAILARIWWTIGELVAVAIAGILVREAHRGMGEVSQDNGEKCD